MAYENYDQIPTAQELYNASQVGMPENLRGGDRFDEFYLNNHELPRWVEKFVQYHVDITTHFLNELGKNYAMREKSSEKELLYPESFFTYLLIFAIDELRLDVVQAVLEHEQTNKQFLNQKLWVGFGLDGKDKVSFLRYLTIKSISGKQQLRAKVKILDMLLDAGATNVQIGYDSCGNIGYTPMQALCNRELWPSITQGTHKRLVKRFRDLNARPHFYWRILLKTPYQIAQETAPYLLELLPDNEDDNGQITIEPVPVMREKRATEIGRQMHESLTSGRMFAQLD